MSAECLAHVLLLLCAVTGVSANGGQWELWGTIFGTLFGGLILMGVVAFVIYVACIRQAVDRQNSRPPSAAPGKTLPTGAFHVLYALRNITT